MNKNGDITDSLVFIITIFILAIGFFIIAFVIPSITDGLKNAHLNDTTEGSNAISKLDNFGSQGIQKGFFFIFIGLCISILITSFFIDTHPIWIFLYIIFLAVAVLIGVYLGNAYETFSTSPAFASFYQSQTLFNLVMSHIVQFCIGVGVLSLIIIFSKFTFGGVQGGSV